METVKHTDLPNGVVVITETLKDYLSVSAGVWLDFGSGDEALALNGIAHYFEHMVFKGTGRFSALEMVQKVESKGGYINAYTTREHTCFYTKTMATEWKESLHILCSMLAEPLLDEVEFNREKEVILEEIQSADDVPDDLAYDLFMKALYGDRGLGRPIAGTLESVNALSHKDLIANHEQQFGAGRIVVALAGPIEHEAVVELVAEAFAKKKNTVIRETSQTGKPTGMQFRERDVGQCSVHLGCSLGDLSLEERMHLHLIHHMWGDGMSSRLFQNIREKHGLVYSIYSGIDLFRTEGTFTVSLAAEENRLEKALEKLHLEVASLQTGGWTGEELNNAKNATIGGMTLHRESTTNRMNALARRVFSDLREMSFKERVHMIDAVSIDQITQLTERLWEPKWTLGAVVPEGSVILGKTSLNFKA